MIKRLFSHSLIYGLAPQISSIAGIIALPIITQDLTEEDFGIWGILMAYVGTLTAFETLGTNVVLTNSFFKMPEQYKWLWRQIYGFLLVWAIPFTMLLGLLLYFVIPEEAHENTFVLLTLLLAPKLFFGPVSAMGTYYYQLSLKPAPIAIRTAIFGTLAVALNIYTISYLKMGYMGWAWSTFIVTMLSNISYWYPINIKLGYKPILNFKWRTIKHSLNVGLPTIPHTYSAFLIDSSDRIVMDQLAVGTGDIGLFNVAAKFGTYFRSLGMAMNKAVTPLMMAAYKKKDEVEARTLVFVLQIAMLIMTFTFAIWSREVFQVLIRNEALNKVYPLAIIIVMAFNYRPMYIGALNKLFYTENTKLLWRVSFIGGIINVGLNLVFIPIYGYEAAAYSTFISLMYLGFSGHFVPKIKKHNPINYYPYVWLLIIIVLTVIAYLSVELSISLKVIISLSIAGMGALMTYLNRGLLLNLVAK